MKTIVYEPDLRIILFEITNNCNALCEHCGSRCAPGGTKELSKADILRVLIDVKKNFGTDIMINISGGEPLMKKDLFEIMTEVTNLGFDWGMVSNGSLITDEIIEKMKSSGMKTITMSIDGLKETHEKLRKLPNSFDKILENIDKLKNAEFLDHIQVTFTANKQNINEFPELYSILSRKKLDSIRVSIVDPIGRASDSDNLLLNSEEIKNLCNFANKINSNPLNVPIEWGCPHFLGTMLKRRKFFCFTGIYGCSVLCNGDIFVCPNVPRVPELIQGNIHKDKFSDVWKNGFKTVREHKIKEYCKDCKYWDKCQGDSLHTWDFEKNKPNFCYRDLYDKKKEDYEKYLSDKYGEYTITSVDSTDGENCPNVYIEPEAYEMIKTIFYFGKRSPLSIYEQQVGLIGFKTDDSYVIKYVFPSYTKRLDKDFQISSGKTIKQAEDELKIAVKNFKDSDDKNDYIGNGLRFLGFAHSHPIQEELQYSIGDEYIHNKLYSKYGQYIGILIYPEKELIGAYIGKPIIQANLKIIERKETKVNKDELKVMLKEIDKEERIELSKELERNKNIVFYYGCPNSKKVKRLNIEKDLE